MPKNFQQTIIQDRQALLQASLLAALEVLKTNYNFTGEQLQEFSEKYVSTFTKNSKAKK
jgi:type III secretory pathway component EscS